MNYQTRNNQQGFSLIEIMVVMFILGILGSVAYLSYNTITNKARASTTQTNLRTIQNAIQLYKLQVNSLPARLQDLVERPKDEAGKKWPGKLVEGNITTDGWGNPLYYKVTTSGKHPYELYSYGENGPETGTPEERIDVWNLQ